MVSVIIPMYNAESTIKTCIDSVLKQTYKGKVEIIVVNDGSKDNSHVIVEELIRTNNANINIHLVKKVNGGVSTARNAGIKLAQGDWIALLDSDDEWLPNKLERQIQVLSENPNIDFLGTNRNRESFSAVLWNKLEHLTKISAKLLLFKNYFSPPTIIFKKQIFFELGGFDENQRYAEEGNYFIRIAQRYNCYLLDESLVITGGRKAHFGHSGLSGNLKQMELGELKNIKDSLNLNIINYFEYIFLIIFFLLKYVSRLLIVKFR